MSSAGQQLVAGRIPGERIATTVETADSASTTTTEIQVMSVTAPLVIDRTYAIRAVLAIKSTAADDATVVSLYRSALGSNQLQVGKAHETPGPAPFGVVLYGEFTATATGNEDFIVGIVRGNGTGDVRMEAAAGRAAYLYVDYIRG